MQEKKFFSDGFGVAERYFQSGYRWNLSGSLMYELLKAIHCALLWYYLDPLTYGKVGSIFSIMYFAIRFADFGFSYSLPPFITQITLSRHHFISFLWRYTLLPGFFPILGIALLVTWWYQVHFTPPYTFVLPLLIVLETVRGFLRMFLHLVFKSKVTVVVELFLFCVYVAFIWLSYLLAGLPLTLDLVFLPHLCDSLLSLIFFFFVLYRYYCSLPAPSCFYTLSGDFSRTLSEKNKSQKDDNACFCFDKGFTQRLTSARFFNYILRINKNLFTSNFLTPLFACVYSLESAGLFYFASSLANALNALIRSVVTFAGGGLFARVKHASLAEKRIAFTLVFEKVFFILLSFFGFFAFFAFIISIPRFFLSFFSLSFFSLSSSVFYYALLYLFIMITEFVFLLYDQFYLLEEMQLRLFSFKFFELSFFFLLFFLNVSQLVSLEFLLFIVFIARLIALLLTALDAYFRWELVPLRTTFFSRSFIFTSFLLIGFLLFVVLLRSIGFVL